MREKIGPGLALLAMLIVGAIVTFAGILVLSLMADLGIRPVP